MGILVLGVVAMVAAPGDDLPQAQPQNEQANAGVAKPDEAAKKKEQVPKLELGTRVHTRYEVGKVGDQPPLDAFSLQRARLTLEFQPYRWLTSQLELDAASQPAVKDAYVEAHYAKWLHLTAGQFKRPFSRIELLSSGKLPLFHRGLVDAHITRGFGYGGRDQGAMASGDLGPLTYGAFNGTKLAPENDSGKDLSGRLTFRPLRAIELGASGSLAYRNPTGTPARTHWAAGCDARLRVAGLEMVGEALWAEEPVTQSSRQQAGAIVYALWRGVQLSGIEVRPIAKFEVLDVDIHAGHDQARVVMAGANLHFPGALRLLVQAEQVFAQAGITDVAPNQKRIAVQLAFDYTTTLHLAATAAE